MNEYHLTIGFLDRESAIVTLRAESNVRAIALGARIAEENFIGTIIRVEITSMQEIMPNEKGFNLHHFAYIPHMVEHTKAQHHMLC